MAWKAFSVIVPPDTRAKIHVSSENTIKELTDLFHPCQLEKRFGGAAETPKNFWPRRPLPVSDTTRRSVSVSTFIAASGFAGHA